MIYKLFKVLASIYGLTPCDINVLTFVEERESVTNKDYVDYAAQFYNPYSYISVRKAFVKLNHYGIITRIEHGRYTVNRNVVPLGIHKANRIEMDISVDEGNIVITSVKAIFRSGSNAKKL